MINEAATKVVYTGDGLTTLFPFPFKYNSAEDINVAIYEIGLKTTTILSKDYYVDTISNTVTYPGYPPGQEPPITERPAVLTNEYQIIIYRNTPLSQEVDLGDKYPLDTLERMDDKAMMVLQEMAEKLTRCLMVDIGNADTAAELVEEIRENTRSAALSASDAKESAENAALNANEVLRNTALAQSAAAMAYNSQQESAANAALAFGASPDAWEPTKTYNYPDVVAATDGYSYRCIGTNVIGTPPQSSSNWVRLCLDLDSFFELDSMGDIMPAENPTFSGQFELDEAGDIMPKDV